MRKIAVTMVAALLVLGASETKAQQVTVPATASITIPTLLSIDVTNTTVTFPVPDLANYDDGGIGMSSGESAISTRGNIIHRVTISADNATMSGPTAKVASDLQWGTDGAGGSFTGLTTGGADVIANLARGTHADVVEVSYRMVLNEATDEPGTYSLAFTYTVLAN